MEGLDLVTISVSELTERITKRLEDDLLLQDVLVRGELSNFTHHSSGHLYFTLKDEQSTLKCVMFRSWAQKLRFRPQTGEDLVVRGRIGVYGKGGQYQLYAQEMFPLGRGALALAFEELKKQLAKEGLFAQERKKPLPLFPKKVGIISSPTGAAIRDFLTVAHRRWPVAELILAPALVQGQRAAASVAQALELLITETDVELIVIARGGGSIEDLWPFNEELLARAIAASAVPVVSAVGHETDFTIADFVADLRAPTPSAAAELVLPDLATLQKKLGVLRGRLGFGLRSEVRFARKRLAALAGSRIFEQREALVAEKVQRLDELAAALGAGFAAQINAEKQKLELLAEALNQLSPLTTLARGYSICRHKGEIVTEAKTLATGDEIELIFAQGGARCEVAEILADER